MSLEDYIKFHFLPPSLHLARIRHRLRRLEPELGILPLLVDRSRIALDVGANKGGYTSALLDIAREVHAFEPNPLLIRWLNRLRHHRGLTIHPFALGDHDGEAILRVPLGRHGRPSSQGGTLRFTTRVRDGFIEEKVPVCCLDSLAIGDVGFIKIDVEGFEEQVVLGARETIAQSRLVMLIEIEEKHTGEPPAALVKRIEDLGYACYTLAEGVLRSAHAPGIQTGFNWIFLPR